MAGGGTARALLAGAICVFSCCSPLQAQWLERVERCLPYPTLAEEIRELRTESAVKPAPDEKPETTLKLDSVEFKSVGSSLLSPSAIKWALAELQRNDYTVSDKWTDWPVEIARGAWQDQGYFTAQVSVGPQTLREDSGAFHASLVLLVDQGKRYRLGTIRIVSRNTADEAPAVSPDELRRLIRLRQGDVFAVGRIRDGLEAMKNRYGDQGYIDFTATPQTDVDLRRGTISLTIELDEQVQYRIGSVEIYGLDQEQRRQLKLVPKTGNTFSAHQVREFFEQNKSLLPPGNSPFLNMNLKRDPHSGTLDMVLTFRHSFTCPQWDE